MLTASLTSCEKIKGWFDVEVDTTIEGELSLISDATELKSTEDYGIDETITVQVLNDDLYEYEDEITSFLASDVTFEVLSVDSSDVVLRAGTEFLISNSQNPGIRVSVPFDWPVEVGASLTLDEASLNVINDILDDMIDFTITATGSCNKGNVTIDLRYGFEVTVIANPL